MQKTIIVKGISLSTNKGSNLINRILDKYTGEISKLIICSDILKIHTCDRPLKSFAWDLLTRLRSFNLNKHYNYITEQMGENEIKLVVIDTIMPQDENVYGLIGINAFQNFTWKTKKGKWFRVDTEYIGMQRWYLRVFDNDGDKITQSIGVSNQDSVILTIDENDVIKFEDL